ncbi:hypothetical protein QYE76_046559 [Lolium multiflorum]|uniref:Glutathione S-transferase n=1 Tax=Lolium multiflorum TaxID=4521 RepID=A0AAD8X0T2_LOLMU|nr:hypothetical protein QYE76_046559 [Lolium multiflorum]
MAGGGGEGEKVKLLGVWDSPFVNRVQIVLNLKGICYEYVEEDLHNKGELLLASNPVHKKVPVLLHDGKAIPESQRATARFWAAFVDDKIGSPWFTILFARKTEEKMEAAARAISAMETLEGAFKDCSVSAGKPFFGGDSIGFVDIVLGSYLGWFVVIETMIGVKLMDATRTPELAAWAERFKMADAVKGVLPEDVDKVLEFLQTFLD